MKNPESADRIKLMRTLLRAGADPEQYAKCYLIYKEIGQPRATVQVVTIRSGAFSPALVRYKNEVKSISLKNICRKVINRSLISADAVFDLPLPKPLQRFVAFQPQPTLNLFDEIPRRVRAEVFARA